MNFLQIPKVLALFTISENKKISLFFFLSFTDSLGPLSATQRGRTAVLPYWTAKTRRRRVSGEADSTKMTYTILRIYPSPQNGSRHTGEDPTPAMAARARRLTA